MNPGIPRKVATRVVARLIDERNELTFDPDVASEVAQRVEVLARVALGRWSGAQRASLQDLHSTQLGEQRAAQEIHPAASLRAATIAFEELYPELLRAEPELTAERAAEDAVIVQEIVGEVVLGAATGYVDHLLARLNSVHLQERRTLAAHLHDHTAQAIASALQRLDYAEVPRDELKTILEGALREVRAVAFDLRQFVGDQRLDEALATYIVNLGDSAPSIELHQDGVPKHFSSSQQEAAYLIVREGLINAVKHSSASVIEIRLTWERAALRVSVADNGLGFDRNRTGPSRMGLVMCRERADAMAASFELSSEPGLGTVLTLGLSL